MIDKITAFRKNISDPDSNIKDIFENILESVSRIDITGNYLSVNNNYADTCGYQPEEMVGMSWRETVHPQDLQHAEKAYEQMLEDGRAEADIRGVRKNRSTFYKHIVLVKGLTNEKSSISHYCFMQDITDRKLQEQKLLQEADKQQQQIQSLAKQIPGAIYHSNSEDCWDFDYISEGITEIIGVSPEKLVGNPDRYIDCIDSADLNRVKIAINTAIANNQDIDVQYRVHHLNRKVRWVQEKGSCRFVDGEFTGIDGVIIDITNQRQTQSQLAHHHIAIKRFYEVVSNNLLSFDEKIEELLQIGIDFFKLDTGILGLIEGDNLVVQNIIAPAGFTIKKGDVCKIDDIYCSIVINSEKPVGFNDVSKTKLAESKSYKGCRRDTYIGAPVFCNINNIICGSLSFSCFDAREKPFSESEIDFIRLLSNWIGQQLQLQQIEEDKRLNVDRYRDAICKLHQIISSSGSSFDEKIDSVIEVALDYLNMEIGLFGTMGNEYYQIKNIINRTSLDLYKGLSVSQKESLCKYIIENNKPLACPNLGNSGYKNEFLYKEMNINTYMGVPLIIGGKTVGTLCSLSTSSREIDFSSSEIEFVQLIAKWIETELERQIATDRLIKAEQVTRDLYKITSNFLTTFEQKVNQILELCVSYLDTEIGIFGKLTEDTYHVIQVYNKSSLELCSGTELAREGSYCAQTASLKRAVALHHVGISDYSKLALYQQLKLETYLGVPIKIKENVFGTICFLAQEPRQEPFSDSEINFIQLAAGWISAEQERALSVKEREQYEHALNISEEREQALIEIQPECFKRITSNGELIYMNPTGLNFIEAASLEEVQGLVVYDLVVEQDREAFIKMNERVFAGETVKLEFEIEGLKGTRRYMETHASPVFDNNGKVIEHLAITRDITERKKTEELLLKYERITSSSLDMMAFVDTDYIYRAVNERYADAHGLTKADIIDNHVEKILGKELFKEAVKPKLDKCLVGENLDFDMWLDMKNKGIRYLHAHYNPYIDISGKIEGVAVVIRDTTEKIKTEQALKEKDLQYSNLVNDIDAIVWEVQLPDILFTFVSDPAEKILGYPLEEWYEEGFWMKHIHPDDRDETYEFCFSETEKNKDHIVDYRMIKSDGSTVWIRDIVHVVLGDSDKPEKLRGVMLDITKQKETEAALIASETRFRTLYDDTPAMFFNTSMDGTILSVNDYGAKHLGYHIEELIGKNVEALFHENDKEPAKEKIKKCFEQPDIVHRWELRKVHKKGHIIWVRESVRVVDDALGGPSLFIVCEDISEAFLLSQQLTYQATHDALTGLVNRTEFERRLQCVLEANQIETSEHALCYLDLDQFKIINDTCGHLAGDELLRQLSEILLTKIRKHDTLARLGGDEFGVLMEYCDIDHARRVTNSLREIVEEFRFVWQDKKFAVGVSIGMVPITVDSGNVNDVLSAADAACYAAKDAGRNRIHVYSAEDELLSQRKGEMLWATRINQALEENLFRLYYQKISSVSGNDKQGEHYELLLRMLGEDGKVIPPGAFLPAAERFGLSTKIDHWVFHAAYTWLATHPNKLKKLKLCSINLSGQTLGNEKFMEFLLTKLDEGLVPPEKICFEITETSAVANLANAIRFIKKLKEKGCYFSLDDFGSGVSSFGYLKNLPVDFLKIDGSFVRDIVSDKIDRAMVKSINDIGQVMGKKTIAEFVENDHILALLKQLGVDYAQGFGIAKPRPIRYSKKKM